MSIINSDGLNTNWQLNVLKGLQGIIDKLTGTVNVNATIAQFGLPVKCNVIAVSGTGATFLNKKTYSISFASNGTGPALVSFDAGATYVSIPAGTTVNMDAGGVNNYYLSGNFGYNTSAAGASLLITYNEL